jgi:hypothetical protein
MPRKKPRSMEAAAAHTRPVSMVIRINLVTLPFVTSLHVDFLAALNYGGAI